MVYGGLEVSLVWKRKVADWTSRVVLNPCKVRLKPSGVAEYWPLVTCGGRGRMLYCWVIDWVGASVVAVTVKG